MIVLVSGDYLASESCVYEMEYAMERHSARRLQVVPIILRPCIWQYSPISSLQALPRNARPISTWSSTDDAWLYVVRELHALVMAKFNVISAPSVVKKTDPGAPPPATVGIEVIFPRGGIPELNYVEPDRFNYLEVYLRDKNGGVIIEGPSGIGKTTATRKALDKLNIANSAKWFRGGNIDHLETLERVLDSPPGGVVVIDDTHHLTSEIQEKSARTIKYNCEITGSQKTKFVLVGINKVGYALLDNFPDLHGRVSTFSMGRQPDHKIEEMIKLGEIAANVRFTAKAEIVREASGSFFMAQQLCFFIAMAANVSKTQNKLVEINKSVAEVTPDILQNHRLKFHKPVTEFASSDGEAEQRGACLALLYRLAFDSDGSILVGDVRRQYPNLGSSFAWLDGGHACDHGDVSALLAGLLHFYRRSGVFSVEDPQLQFYLKNLEWTMFAKQVGIKAKITPDGWLHIGTGAI